MLSGAANLEACKTKARPSVVVCMQKTLNAIHGRSNTLLELANEITFVGPHGQNALPAAFVAPPRAIKDIAAIRDAEMPDPKKIEERRARADAIRPPQTPPGLLARLF
jgi:hypothetical protein